MKNRAAKKRLLLVEDEEDLREPLLNFIKKHFDCEIMEASGGHEAFKFLRASAFDLVVSDFAMPEGNGLELLESVRNGNLNTPFIIFSGTPQDLLEPCLGTPVVAIVQKPNVDRPLTHLRKILLEIV